MPSWYLPCPCIPGLLRAVWSHSIHWSAGSSSGSKAHHTTSQAAASHPSQHLRLRSVHSHFDPSTAGCHPSSCKCIWKADCAGSCRKSFKYHHTAHHAAASCKARGSCSACRQARPASSARSPATTPRQSGQLRATYRPSVVVCPISYGGICSTCVLLEA